MALFNESAVIIDPMVPKDAARALRNNPNDLIAFAEDRVPAEQRDIRALLVPVIATEAAGITIAALAIYRLGAYDIAALHLQQVPYFLVIAAMLTGFLVMLAGIVGLRHWGDIRYERRSKANATRYHRRYVFPDTDLDSGARATWGRVVRATNAIYRARATREKGGIDPVWMSTVLPHHQWDIAESLARLSALRKRQREILSSAGNDPDARDEEIAAVLIPQQRAQELAIADIERHVRLLEDLASQITTADAALRRARAARRLATLDDQHAELLARVNRQGTWYTEDLEQVSSDLRVVTETLSSSAQRSAPATSEQPPPGSPGAPPLGGLRGLLPRGTRAWGGSPGREPLRGEVIAHVKRAVGVGLTGGQRPLPARLLAEQPRPRPQHHRVHEQVQLVDQAVGDHGSYQRATATDIEPAGRVILEPADHRRIVAADDLGVTPRRLLQGRRHDVLHRVVEERRPRILLRRGT